MNRIVVVSNRVPVPTGGEQAGGLAVSLAALMSQRGGLWFGWSGKVVEAPATAPVCIDVDHVRYATIDLSPDEHERYYNDFSNGLLWPLLHSMPNLMRFDRDSSDVYRNVNERMASALSSLLRPNDIVWVHDYHLMALPAMLRARGVRAPIGFFLHVPFPSPDMLAMAPDAAALLRDLLAADLIGFQTSGDLENFALSAVRLAGAQRVGHAMLAIGQRRVRLGAFPVEIEATEFAATAEQAWRSPANERLRRSIAGQKLILGVDRLDPTKGIPQRIAGFRRLLETKPDWIRGVTFLQIAALSRETVAAYRDLRAEVEADAGHVNSEFSEPDWMPLRVVARAGARATVAGYMREARVGLVTPLRDGMNLVAKEYIAAQNPDDPGVLVLSRFAGAAEQFTSALLVNPHDRDEIADALDRALHMKLFERKQRWAACWNAIAERSGVVWGRSFLAALLRAHSPASKIASTSISLAADPITLPDRLTHTRDTRRGVSQVAPGKPH